MEDLAGKVAVVTGGASGIGRGICRRLAAVGLDVAVADIDADGASAVAAELRECGVRALGVAVDVTDRESVTALADRTFAELGGVHVVCNNAGVIVGGTLCDAREQGIQAGFSRSPITTDSFSVAAPRLWHSMIKNFNDHAANERTYLAYLRTGLALMGFGFVIERFDLFVRDRSSGQSVGALVWLVSSEVAGFLLLLAGVFVLALSTHRYLRFKKQISSEEITELGSSRREWILVGVLGSAGVFLCLYVARVFLE